MPNDQTAQTDATQTPPEEITYTPTVWADGEDGGTPINAANMNNIEEAIVALVERTAKQVVTSMIADGAVTNAKLDQTLRDSLSRAPFATTIMAEDLNDHEVGAVAFKYDTANIPSGFEYGICICLRATTSWLWQIAISTNKNAVFIRNKVNNASWSAWTSL